MRPYGQKRVYVTQGLTRARRPKKGGKIHVSTGVKNRKLARKEKTNDV